MYIVMFTLFVTEYFLIWMQPLELKYLFISSSENLSNVQALFFISKRSSKC